MSIRMMSAAVLAAALVVAGGVASADMSRPVISAFKGQVVVSKQELPEGKNDKDTIAKIKAAKVAALTGEAQEDVTYWNFHYTAFLSKTGASKLKLEFYNGKQLAADKTLDGIDPKSAVLSGDISINEDEGLAKGKTYTVKLVNGSSVVASTSLTMK
ncbi:MAG: hypothetical protein H0T42_33635 [Deltaproteobacteria bacterium]|nr:hypothetical protein [Deltaproteobacteria bacterium]